MPRNRYVGKRTFWRKNLSYVWKTYLFSAGKTFSTVFCCCCSPVIHKSVLWKHSLVRRYGGSYPRRALLCPVIVQPAQNNFRSTRERVCVGWCVGRRRRRFVGPRTKVAATGVLLLGGGRVRARNGGGKSFLHPRVPKRPFHAAADERAWSGEIKSPLSAGATAAAHYPARAKTGRWRAHKIHHSSTRWSRPNGQGRKNGVFPHGFVRATTMYVAAAAAATTLTLFSYPRQRLLRGEKSVRAERHVFAPPLSYVFCRSPERLFNCPWNSDLVVGTMLLFRKGMHGFLPPWNQRNALKGIPISEPAVGSTDSKQRNELAETNRNWLYFLSNK